jgi:hypothetical protein
MNPLKLFHKSWDLCATNYQISTIAYKKIKMNRMERID